jgi:hypothetical protein
LQRPSPRRSRFLDARLSHDGVRHWLQRQRIFGAIEEAVAEAGWKIVALLRLSPAVPFTEIPFWHFVIATRSGINAAHSAAGSVRASTGTSTAVEGSLSAATT